MKDKKDVWKPITDPALALQIQARKWREDHVTWVVRDGVTWVLKDEHTGKISCRNDKQIVSKGDSNG